jgi:peroxiredoxin
MRNHIQTLQIEKEVHQAVAEYCQQEDTPTVIRYVVSKAIRKFLREQGVDIAPEPIAGRVRAGRVKGSRNKASAS